MRAHAALRGLLATQAPRTFVVERDADVEAALDGYLGAFAPSDPVSLVIPLAPGADPDPLYARLVGRIGALGHDPEAIPDVAVHLWAPGATVPATAVMASPEAWRAAADPEPSATAEPRAALVVRLPSDDAEAAAQLRATLDAGVGADVELLVALADGQAAPLALRPSARLVRHAPDAGRRAVLARALGASRAPLVAALEPHVLPEPGFLEPLLAAVADGAAALAAPVLDGAHGLRVGADGALWPLAAGDTPDALPLDALAATRATWLAMPAALPPRDGHAEAQLGAWATARGPLAVPAASRARRAPAPPATVIVCTRDREEILEDVVELVVAQGARRAAASSTTARPTGRPRSPPRWPRATPASCASSTSRSAACRAPATPARAAARHDLLIYIDDDARPVPGWLPAFARELARPGVVCAGGPITGLWPPERTPEWPAPGLEALYGILDHGDGDRTLVAPDIVYGGNWGIHRSALEQVGGFDPDLGVAPGVRIGGEEAAVAWSLQRGDLGATRYVAAAGVGHLIGAHRVTDRYLADRGLTIGLERPRHRADATPEDLMRSAQLAAHALHQRAPLSGTLRLEDVLDAIAVSDLEPVEKVTAAASLGEMAACLLLLGLRQAEIGAMTVTLTAGHLNGLLEPVAA